MKKLYLFILLIISFYVFCYSSNINYKRIIYLSDSSLFIYDINTKSIVKFSSEDDRITDYIVSPDFKYIAYSKVISFNECVGGFVDDDSVPVSSEMPVYSIKIFDLKENTLIKEIKPLSEEFINLDKWIGKDELLCGFGDCEVFDGWISYMVNDTVKRYGDLEGKNYSSIIGISKDSEYKFYVDNKGALHKTNLISKSDLIFPNLKTTIIDCEQSNNKKFVSWLEVVNKTRKDNKTGAISYDGSIDKVILFSVSDWKAIEIYSNDASRIRTRKYITFSPNDSIVTIENEKEITLRNIYTLEKFLIFGHNINWIDSNNFIYSNNKCIFQYDIRLKKSKLIINNSDLAYTIK